ncbi:MAG: diguanylate cyclase [Woeseiaceae bacterium]|nr:diguanylate cyclase [Woeseiaceae bacterium]
MGRKLLFFGWFLCSFLGMDRLSKHHLLQVLTDIGEPLLIVSLDKPDWPIVFSNEAFASIAKDEATSEGFADLMDRLLGREMAIEISDALRARHASSFAVDFVGREYMLTLKLPTDEDSGDTRYCAVSFRRGGAQGSVPGVAAQHSLLKSKRTQDLKRDDVVTGLLNELALRELFGHDWAVAQREQTTLSVVLFQVQDFPAYVHTFGRHASDACLRKVGQAIRRCLRRASDVVARVDDDKFVVLSHASEATGVTSFAERIADNVRELGLHHPKSSSARFVTLAFDIEVATPASENRSADELLDDLIAGHAIEHYGAA